MKERRNIPPGLEAGVPLRIVWDEAKNEKNKRDHNGLGFETAQYVFADPERVWRFDRSECNTSGEERWQTIGKAGNILFVVYTEKEGDGAVETRLISARIAEKSERRSYHGHYQIDGKGWTKDT
jgi:uncharacterized DUF497 family protein